MLGYRAPLAAAGHAPQQLDFLLLRWEAEGDPLNPGGLTLLRVAGFVADPAAALRGPGDPAVTVLAQAVGPSLGWIPDHDHSMALVHRRSRLVVEIDGEPRLDVAGDFGPGRFGFFTDSQPDATFSGFESHVWNEPPSAEAGSDLFLEATGACGVQALLDASGSNDPDGDRLSFLWTGPFGAASGETASAFVPVGTHPVTLVVDDGNGANTSDTLTVDVADAAPPLLACPAAVTVTPEPGSCYAGAADLGVPTALDACGVADVSNDSPVEFPQGQTLVTWTATDTAGLRTSCSQRVTVTDVVPPELEAALATTRLWPPNHSLEDVGLTSTASDGCGAPAPATFLEVWSDEPDEGTGDGNHPGDAALEEGALLLRSERQGGGDGRVYLVVVTALDAAGNDDFACLTAVVPRSAAGQKLADVLAQADAAAQHCEGAAERPRRASTCCSTCLSSARTARPWSTRAPTSS